MPRSRASKQFVDDRPAKKAPKVARNSKQYKNHSNGIELMQVKPMTHAQGEVIEAFFENHLMLNGPAGTGKTFIPLYMALREILEEGTRSPFQKIVIIRSSVQSRDQGFLPGSEHDKMAPFERPYRDAVNQLCQRGDAYDLLKQKGVIEFESTSFLRGCTLDNSVIVLDEAQNCNEQELDTVLTRIGKNSKIVVCGDYVQSDLKGKDKEGFLFILGVLKVLPRFETVTFTYDDIVRSAFVKAYIIARDEARAKR